MDKIIEDLEKQLQELIKEDDIIAYGDSMSKIAQLLLTLEQVRSFRRPPRDYTATGAKLAEIG